MTADAALTIDDLVTGKVAEQLGEGVLPTRALLIVETITEHGRGLRYMLTEGVQTWDALGLLQSVQIRFEMEDAEGWRE